MQGTNMSGTSMVCVDLSYASMDSAVLTYARMANTIMDHTHLNNARMASARIVEGLMNQAQIYGADLSRARMIRTQVAGVLLAGANLTDMVMKDVILDGERISRTPIQLLGLTWPVYITPQYMRIGCQRHKHEEWAGFDDARIQQMDLRQAPAFWRKHRDVLLAICKQQAAAQSEGARLTQP